MTRKSACFISLVLLACVPGCKLLPGRGASGDVQSHSVDERFRTQPIECPSTADARGDQDCVTAKSLHVDATPRPLNSPSPLAVREERNANSPGSGRVTLEEMAGPRNAIFQTSPSAAGQTDVTTALLGQGPHDEEAVEVALRLIFRGEHQEAIKALKAYPESTQEFFIRILPLLTQVARKSIDKMSSREIQIFLEQARALEDFLRTRSELLVSEMAYCKRIRGFGDYEALPDNHAFLAKTDNRPGDLVQLYVELKNFASKKTADGDYLTKLACSLELKDMQNNKVWSHTFDKAVTTLRRSTCVNDYHGNFSFYVPALPVGTYQLTFQVVDETIPEHRRFARRSQVFRVTPVANALAPR